MVILLTRMRVKTEDRSRFESIFAQIADIVKGTEPENLLYKMVRSVEDPNEYRCIEFYTSQEAVDFHFNNPAASALKDDICALFSDTPEILAFEEVG